MSLGTLSLQQARALYSTHKRVKLIIRGTLSLSIIAHSQVYLTSGWLTCDWKAGLLSETGRVMEVSKMANLEKRLITVNTFTCRLCIDALLETILETHINRKLECMIEFAAMVCIKALLYFF